MCNFCCIFGRRLACGVTNICSNFGRRLAYGNSPESSSYLAKLERLFLTNVPTTIFLAKEITLKQA